MRIFYASDTTPNSAFNSNLWRDNLFSTLVEMGHDVVEFQYDLRRTFRNLDTSDPVQSAFIGNNRPKLSRELIRQVKAAHAIRPLDLFFSYFYDACVLPETIDEIRSWGITTVNWYCNASYQLHLVSEISRHYDWCLVPEKFRLEDYRALGARPIYCQEAANPKIYRPYPLPVEFDVTFVGQAYGDRPAYLRYLLDHGIDVRVWGFGWREFYSEGARKSWRKWLRRGRNFGRKLATIQDWRDTAGRLRQILEKKGQDQARSIPTLALPEAKIGGTLSDLQLVQRYSRSKSNLGFSTCGNLQGQKKILQIRLRDFEVPMSGGFYLTEYMKELEEFYNIGTEIVCYRDPAELADKINYYLQHETAREAIRRAGYERCLREHTWQHRFSAAFKAMGLV